ncbi:MAG: 50S ribosomal protein L5 [Candidatus Jacksonbacteria bacterium RIFCSPLOWO2_02_FULL_43_9]|nr:MAG: 50S ribosomal protein L5 [Parcubacteria group bacterium GW2011_GWA2_43_13]OGY69179.1 MAG: 50S ribosomal protein L5 [Candidatus Jacksonbacteria bacterium RIFCSPHIGHO2_02_FULL_43_10]OGY70494.1 MAG: 50S ribosomal protein L5 [Candidatus Jacksonbacteria bacterium RIFCSPLOWO2_01_FULL_44_13]OGY72818.1 MAG: 50S ribosomal protein L5 [Candidatus Jacksonbacteria bacterium RIFCSPLOWO2_02_FULL_43_9]HAZ16396.1 50S ribosomal protein L5 [Candidatus Jacksonbacteria bacterium]
MNNLKKNFDTIIVKKLKDELGLSNVLAVPWVKKITLNVGIGKMSKDQKAVDTVKETLVRISGQKPVETKARQSIAGFKLREGSVVGMMVTLRGRRMYDFLERLVHITLPRVRDFRGIPMTSVDQSGNLSIGLSEHYVFPEVNPDTVEHTHGLQITISVQAQNRDHALALYREFGMPFVKEKL